jgi:hypothetical protein
MIGPPRQGDAPPPHSQPQPILPILVRTVEECQLGNDNNKKTTRHDNQQQKEMMISSSTEWPLFVVALFLPERPTLFLRTLGGHVRRAIRDDHVVVGAHQHGVRVVSRLLRYSSAVFNPRWIPASTRFKTQIANPLLHNPRP